MSIAKVALSVEGVREAIIKQLLGSLNQECSQLCQKIPAPTLFHKIPVETLAEFKWDQMMAELEQSAPLLLKIVHCLVARNDGRNKSKVGTAHYPGICAAVAVLLKERNREMCGLQSLLSLVMYSCHCEKQVHTYINKHSYSGVAINGHTKTISPHSSYIMYHIRMYFKGRPD